MADRETSAPLLRRAVQEDLPLLVRFIQAYYRFEGVDFNLYRVERGILPLLTADDRGRVWLIQSGTEAAGYIVLCFGHSVEAGGRDAMIDEFFVAEAHRGRGVGRRALRQVLDEARALGVTSVFLEVARDNRRAAKLYAAAGFESREKYFLMRADLGDGDGAGG